VVSLSEGADGTDLVSDKESLNSVWREFLCAISVVFTPSRISPFLLLLVESTSEDLI